MDDAERTRFEPGITELRTRWPGGIAAADDQRLGSGGSEDAADDGFPTWSPRRVAATKSCCLGLNGRTAPATLLFQRCRIAVP
jgi:hypothetical protein